MNRLANDEGSPLKLVIGNKNYSSWSLRPWILMQHSGIEFDEIRIPLFTTEGEKLLEKWCPAKQVPVLHDGPLVLWDSLAICEYIADKNPHRALMPDESSDRAKARAMSAEMHSGFGALRTFMPMNCRRIIEGFEPDLNTRIDINRIVQLLEQALDESGGPWLFGRYSVADAMFAPVASRFHTYGIKAPGNTRSYFEQVLADPAMQTWYRAAVDENEVIEKSEVIL
ncbi:MAG: glutathione S-transferase family protein [Granulosicoccus sp.]